MKILIVDVPVVNNLQKLTETFFKGLAEDDRFEMITTEQVKKPFWDIPLGKYDAVVLPGVHSAKSSKPLKCPVLVRMPDPKPWRLCRPEFVDVARDLGVDGFWGIRSASWLRRQLPCLDEFSMHHIVPGMHRNLGVADTFATHGGRGKPLMLGCRVNIAPYRGRVMCAAHPSTISLGHGSGYYGDDYSKKLLSHHAGVAACEFIVDKYFELPACGMLTFMWRTPTQPHTPTTIKTYTDKEGHLWLTEPGNGFDDLGFVDGETCVVVEEHNYKDRLDEYAAAPNDPKWDKIARQGQEFVLATYGFEAQKAKLINTLEEMI